MHRADEPALTNRMRQERDRLLEEYKPFILRTASFVLKKYVSQSDDAWSVALIAFWEAADRYDRTKGDFQVYARMVIKRRLIDHQRKQRKFAAEIDVAPETFTGDTEPDDAFPQTRVKLHPAETPLEEEALREELAEASHLFSAYGFDFMDLVECSPKSGKTKAACAQAAAFLLQTPDLIRKMRQTRRLPIQAVASGARVSLKLIHRHRRYIIASVEILDGDYPGLATYLESIKKR